MLVREQIGQFLSAASAGLLPVDCNQPKGPFRDRVNNPDILEMYSPSMEVQVKVRSSNGKPVEGKRNTWVRDGQEFWNIRCPKGAMSEPTWRDYELNWSLSEHAEAVGMTGWDWENRCSRWVCFDFDAITGHAPGIGVSDDQLMAIREAAWDVPYVQVRKSTRGGGFHFYVFFSVFSYGQWIDDGIPCENHTLHAALARTILAKLSMEANFNFAGAIDACGGNMWVWHRDACLHNEGLALIKDNTSILTQDDLPPNWRDHVDVVTRKRAKIKLAGVPDSQAEEFDALASGRNNVALDDNHNLLIQRIHELGYTAVWVPEFNLLQTHTCGFKDVFERHREEYSGFYETSSEASDPGEPNCLAGGTKVITREGVKDIKSLAGKTVEVITSRGKWVQAPFKSYGQQSVMEITLKKKNHRKKIRATLDHDWFVAQPRHHHRKVSFQHRKKVKTSDLQPNDILVQVFPQLKATPSLVGIQHGIVWGDGTVGGGRTNASVSLFGEKATDLLPLFNGHQVRDLEDGNKEVWNLPLHFKSLVNLSCDKAYLLGWLAGYFATDGCTDNKGVCMLNSVDKDSIECVREVCQILGIHCSPITWQERESYFNGEMQTVYKVHLKTNTLPPEFFLRKKHQERITAKHDRADYWKVESVELLGEKEEVFCCTVPETHCFTLEDSILTGNCFAFPLSNGGWKVTRFSKGVREHETWDQDGTNWTSCYFNTRPDLESASLALGGSEISGGKGFHFDNLKKARDVVQALGGYIDLPDTWDNRECQLDKNKSNGRLIVRVKKVPEEAKPQNGWIEKGKWWEKVFKITTDSSEVTMNEYPEFDSYVRALVTPGGEHAGWAVKRTDKDTWDIQPLVNVKLVLQGAPYNVSKAEADVILGGTINRRWDLVTLPFKPEFPGNRQWNFKAPQYAFQPSDLDSDAIPYHPHWDKILDHVGRDLDESLCTDAWALRHGIMTGRQYLQLWIASMLREPFDPLPYLFLWGPENSGKSILHEAIGRLMTGGVASADRALTTSSEFNGELANAVLGVIEETDVSKAGERARNRMKDWVTSENIAIRRMRTDAYLQRNTLHFIQCSNSSDACLVTHGDTRTVVLYVPEIEAEIPKEVLKRNIEDEASDFMYTLMNLDIPPSEGRLRIPPVSTGSKEDMEQSTMSALDLFLLEHTYHVNGCTIKYSEFVERFLGQLPIEEIGLWNNRSVSRKLPRKYPTGKYGGDGATHIGNISWTPGSHGDELVSFRGRLKYRGV